MALDVDPQARRDHPPVHDCSLHHPLAGSRFTDRRLLDLDQRHLVRVVQREGHVAVALLLEQERGRLAAPGLLTPTDLDLAVDRVIVLLPLHVAFTKQQQFVKLQLILSAAHPVSLVLAPEVVE